MVMPSKLKSLDELKAFDGEKSKVELNPKRCSHDNLDVRANQIFCKDCGAGWTGNARELKLLLKLLNDKKVR